VRTAQEALPTAERKVIGDETCEQMCLVAILQPAPGRWNPGVASENLALTKAFGFGPENRFQATLRAEFYDAFNRHYINGPDTNPNDQNFGQITSVSGKTRTGQLGARVQW